MTSVFRCLFLLFVVSFAAPSYAQTNGSASSTPPAVVDVKNVDRGVLDGLNYVNDFFGLSLSIPQSWIVVSAQRRAEIADDSRKILGGDQKKQAQIEESIQRSVNLLSLTKLPAGEPHNASFMLIAERIPLPTIKTGADVIDTMKNAMKGTNFNVEFVGEIQTEQIGGATFSIAIFKNSSPAGVFMQKVYVTTKNGYALEIFYTYMDDSDHAGFESIIKSIKMK
jgi:hypothetical protein